MNSWLSKKLHSQFRGSDVPKQALSKLEQLESRNDTRNSGLRTPSETSFVCRNCSTVSSRFNNTISVTINQDLLAKTELGNLTTVEELTQDPGFEEFLSSQLQLYFKFITNASTNNLFSKAKRKVAQDATESLACAHNSLTKDAEGVAPTGSSQQAFRRPDNIAGELDLSLIEEEDPRGEAADFARNCHEVENSRKEKSPPRGRDMIQSPTRSPTRQTQRSKQRQQADASAIPGSSLMNVGDSPMRSRPLQQTKRSKEREQAEDRVLPGSSVAGAGHSPVRSRPLRQCQRSKEREQADNRVIPRSSVADPEYSPVRSQPSQERHQVESVIQASSSTDVNQTRRSRKPSPAKPAPKELIKADASIRKSSRSTKPSNIAETSTTTQTSTRTRVQKSAEDETQLEQTDDGVFKVPPPPKPRGRQKSQRSRSNDDDSRDSDGRRAQVSSQLPDKDVFKVPLPDKPRKASAQKADTEPTGALRSRTGRISKPPGSFWELPSENRKPEPRPHTVSQKIAVKPNRNESRVAESDRRNQSSSTGAKTAEKRRADKTLSGLDSESGYSSAIVPAQMKTSSRKKSRVIAAKEPENPPNLEEALITTLKDSRGTSRKAQTVQVQPAEEAGDDPPVETVEEQPPTRRPLPAKVKPTEVGPPSASQVELSRGRHLSQVEHSNEDDAHSKKMPARKNIFSESDSESCDETCLLSNTKSFYNPNRKREVNPAQDRMHSTGRTSLIESSADEEVLVKKRRPVRPKKIAPLQRKRIEEDASSEEDDPPGKSRNTKKKPYADADSDTSPGQSKKIAPLQRKRIEEDGSSEEDDPPGKSRNAKKKPYAGADSDTSPGRPKKIAPLQRKRIEEDASSEEDDPPRKLRNAKKKPYADANSDTSPVANRTMKRQRVKAPRYLFSGSSTDDDSMCSSRRNTRNGRDRDSSSFWDDASYVSSVRNSRDREIPSTLRPTARNRNNEESRRPRLVSRFRR